MTSQNVKEQWEITYKPGSFTNPDKLWKSLSDKEKHDIGNREVVENILFSEESYLTNGKVKYCFPIRKVVSNGINYQWDCDVAYLEYKQDNKPYMGFLCCIGMFSRKVYACLISTANNIIECFKHIFKETKPQRIRTDLGGEFRLRLTTSFLRNKNVILFHTDNNLIKSNYCKRVIYTLKVR